MGAFQRHLGQALLAVVIGTGARSGNTGAADAGYLVVSGLVEQDERIPADAAHRYHGNGFSSGHSQGGIKSIAAVLEYF